MQQVAVYKSILIMTNFTFYWCSRWLIVGSLVIILLHGLTYATEYNSNGKDYRYSFINVTDFNQIVYRLIITPLFCSFVLPLLIDRNIRLWLKKTI